MKALVVALVILALLFAVGVGLGARGEPQGRVDVARYDWLGTLTRPFGAGARLDLGALAGPCVTGRSLAVSPGLGCGLRVPGGKRVRSLELVLTQGSLAALDFQPAGGPAVRARQKLRAGDKPSRFAVPAEGGVLEVVCLDAAGASFCRLDAP